MLVNWDREAKDEPLRRKKKLEKKFHNFSSLFVSKEIVQCLFINKHFIGLQHGGYCYLKFFKQKQ